MEFTTQVALPVSVDRAMELRTDESLLRKAAERVNADLISISVVPVEVGHSLLNKYAGCPVSCCLERCAVCSCSG